MNYKIVILGWGSLIYELCELKEYVKLPWQVGGPILPIEFSRISKSRDRALTLVIDPNNGVDNPTKYIESTRKDPKDTACDLRNRESTIIKNIGILDIKKNYINSNNQKITEIIKQWMDCKDIRAVIWTDLQSNFKEKSKNKYNFSIKAALDHLNYLSEKGREEAKAYVRNAPDFIDTPLRKELKTIGWY
jgi:hypothetical protein